MKTYDIYGLKCKKFSSKDLKSRKDTIWFFGDSSGSPATLVCSIFETIGRAAKRVVNHYWSDIIHDIHGLEHRADKFFHSEEGYKDGFDFVWMGRDMGTHLHDPKDAMGLDWLKAAVSTYGTSIKIIIVGSVKLNSKGHAEIVLDLYTPVL